MSSAGSRGRLGAALAAAAALGWGAAAAQTTGSVEIAWDAVAAADLAGYRVFAHTDPNLFAPNDPNAAAAVARVIPVGASITDVIVTNLNAAVPWFFAVTAVDLSGNESGFSNVVASQPSVTPTVRSVSPSAARQGDAGVVVTIGGANFVAGATADFGAGVTVSSPVVSGGGTILTVNVDVDPLAQVSTRTVTVTNPGGASGSRASSFSVAIDPARLDIDRSGRVDGADFLDVLLGFPSVVGDQHYNTNRDLDVDGRVDGADIALILSPLFFGR